MSVLVIAGLGNPGPRYRHTRHNIGFTVVDALAAECGAVLKEESRFNAETAKATLGERSLHLVKPLTFMNASGECLGPFCRYYKIPVENLVVVYDEVQIDLGRVKLSLSGSAGGHNGIEDILRHVGDGFVRYRIGVGPKEPPEADIKDFVLGKFTAYQQSIVNKKTGEYLSGLNLLVDRGPVLAMNQINQRNRTDEPNGNET